MQADEMKIPDLCGPLGGRGAVGELARCDDRPARLRLAGVRA